MLRTTVEAQLRDEQGEDGFLFPDYDGYCFANVPGTLLDLAGVTHDRTIPRDAYDTEAVEYVVCLVVDGLAFHNWKRDLDRHRLMDAFTDAGTVTPITSVYPSETAAAMTTFNTGLDPVEHGILGWNQFVPELGETIETLPFSTQDGTAITEVYPNFGPGSLFPAVSWYDDARDHGIDTASLYLKGLDDSAGRLVGKGDREYRYGTVPSAGEQIGTALDDLDGPGIVTAYVNHLDSISHSAGTDSDLYHTTVEQLGAAFDRLQSAVAPETAKQTACIVTADHGHLAVDPGESTNLSEHPEIFELLARGDDGEPIPPVGGPRNVRFHAAEGQRDRLRSILEDTFDAYVTTREAALDRGLFGRGEPAADFPTHCGDVICVPREAALWWQESDLEKVSNHGGLHPDEMLAPFAMARLDRLAL